MMIGEVIEQQENLFGASPDALPTWDFVSSDARQCSNLVLTPSIGVTIRAAGAVSYRLHRRVLSELVHFGTHDGGIILSDLPDRVWVAARTQRLICVYNARWLYTRDLTYSPRTVPFAQMVHKSIARSLPPHVAALGWIKDATELSDERIAGMFGVSRQALDGWREGKPIKDKNRQRIFAVRDVLERAMGRYQTCDQLLAWLDDPRGLDGRTPAQLLAAGEIDRARLLAIAYRSPDVRAPRPWAQKAIAERFRGITEYRDEAVPDDAND